MNTTPVDALSRHWIQTYRGNRFDLLNPDAAMLDIDEIAHALSHICRFTGHVRQFLSVAQHSVMVSELVDERFAFDGLMHDATEAFVGDVARPLKQLIPDYEAIETRIGAVIAGRYGLTVPQPAEVKEADVVSLLWERRDLMSPPPEVWADERFVALVPSRRVVSWSPSDAKAAFLRRFAELGGQ